MYIKNRVNHTIMLRIYLRLIFQYIEKTELKVLRLCINKFT